MRMQQSRVGEPLLPAALAGLAALFVSILVGAMFSPVHDPFGLENVTIIYMAVVAIAAIAGGTYGGLIAALVASLSYNFFFTTPYRTLRIDSTEQVVTVALLFVAGVLISLATNATRGRLVDTDESSKRPAPNDDARELLDSADAARSFDGRHH
jgi:two-component system, OmpR family, sensor histidine kinase KdpD